MIRIRALDVVLEQDTLNRIAQEWIPRGGAIRSLTLELLPGSARVQVDGHLPIVGDKSVTADLSVRLEGNELWLKLERTSLPLVPRAALVTLVASQANQTALRADGSSLVLDLAALFAKFEIETRVDAVSLDQGSARLFCRMEPESPASG